MATTKQTNSTTSLFWRELFSVGLYKRSQGRITRQVTFAVLALMLLLGAWSLQRTLSLNYSLGTQYLAGGLVAVAGLWLAFRLVNMPAFADFLIAVEAEMNKVSWPTRTELIRASVVVLVVMFGLAALLFTYDFFWRWLLGALGVIG